MQHKIINKIIIGLISLSILLSCEDNTDSLISQYKLEGNLKNSDDKINIEEAKIVANAFFGTRTDKNNTLRNGTQTQEIKETYQIATNDTSSVFLGFNFDGGGFVITSSDKRFPPIMAYSDKGSISKEVIDSESFILWKNFISEELNSEKDDAETNKSKWNGYLESHNNTALRASDDRDKKLSPNMIKLLEIKQLEEVAPLVLTTEWDQHDPYNKFCPNNYPAGCVAIAIGQIMNYHKIPKKSKNIAWNWANINKSEPTDVGKFIRYIGDGVEMQYGKNGSHPKVVLSLNNLHKRELKFLRDEGYNAEEFDFKKSIKRKGIEELKQKRPFLMDGFTSEILMFIPLHGHMWVCDGYQLYQEKEIIPPEVPLDLSKMSDEEYVNAFWTGRYTQYYYLNFNWGWRGKDNGWFYGGIPRDKDDDKIKNKNYRNHLKFITVKPF